jgi:hypothetical protein
MSDFRTRKSFEKAFIKSVYNFDETKIWFEHPSKMYQESNICFSVNNKLYRLPMYKSQWHIDIWKNHFIEFINTGEFDFNSYWQLYGCKNKEHEKEIYKFPCTIKNKGVIEVHSEEMLEFLDKYRKTIDDGCGIQNTCKPLNYE